jgi:hypothetical protein
VATAKSEELHALAQRIADALPKDVEEVVLTGSVSRGMADDRSDIEMLVVTPGQPEREACYAASGLPSPQSWGARDTPSITVFGYCDGVPIEQIWWSRAYAETRVSAAAEALANGVALRTSGLLAEWQEQLADYPEELAAERIEDAALTWGGFAPEGLLTVTRPGERFALVERLVDDASRVCRIVFALNRVWEPTHKRLAERVAELELKPERLAERIEHALTEPEATVAARTMAELQLETVELAPAGPNIDRARVWLVQVIELLR